jgi:hypothetical protein
MANLLGVIIPIFYFNLKMEIDLKHNIFISETFANKTLCESESDSNIF